MVFYIDTLKSIFSLYHLRINLYFCVEETNVEPKYNEKMKFENVEKSIDWLNENSKRDSVFYIAVSIKDSTVEVCDTPIRKAKNRIVRKISRHMKGQKWNSAIREAFGGYVCKSTVVEVLGKRAASEVPVDVVAANPHYKTGAHMYLYLRDKIDAIKQIQIENR